MREIADVISVSPSNTSFRTFTAVGKLRTQSMLGFPMKCFPAITHHLASIINLHKGHTCHIHKLIGILKDLTSTGNRRRCQCFPQWYFVQNIYWYRKVTDSINARVPPEMFHCHHPPLGLNNKSSKGHTCHIHKLIGIFERFNQYGKLQTLSVFPPIILR